MIFWKCTIYIVNFFFSHCIVIFNVCLYPTCCCGRTWHAVSCSSHCFDSVFGLSSARLCHLNSPWRLLTWMRRPSSRRWRTRNLRMGSSAYSRQWSVLLTLLLPKLSQSEACRVDQAGCTDGERERDRAHAYNWACPHCRSCRVLNFLIASNSRH